MRCATTRAAAWIPSFVKAFINLTGIYPVGTLVVLDTFELAIVHAVNPIADMLSRPIVRIIATRWATSACRCPRRPRRQERGRRVLRTIIKTEDPDRYGIRIGDYFI